ncbi:MAG: N-acetylneuraminate synthase family protein [Candidatus Omnitrophica bacterium]|nr:N-acetylneuraminate synthase family protein [Candidatus Omnitrophota bacterium]
MKTIIIAEIGECFNGDMDQARKLIVTAKAAGCDYAKFQTLDREGIAEDDPEREWFLKVALQKEQLTQLQSWCRDAGIGFLCTPENKKKAEELKELGCREVKIASTCAWDDELVSYISEHFSIIFVSTGLSTLEEVDKVVSRLKKQEKIYLMHCVSEYPTGPLLTQRGLQALSHENVNLRMMDILKERYPHCVVGYSDHTVDIIVPVVAVARGAGVIEKHITLDRKGPVNLFLSKRGYSGTDHVLSLEPDELKEMVRQIRETEKILGEAVWQRSPGEKILMDFLKGRFSNP